MDFSAINNSIIYAYRGSIAHNLYIPPEEPLGTDDKDYIGICISPINYYTGLDKFDQYEYQENGDDIIVYDIKKAFRLLLNSNPNILSILWNRPDMYIRIEPLGQKIIDNRHIFASKKIYKTFVGYALSQLKRMNKSQYKGYMGSKKKELVDKYGFDVKMASHTIRLLKCGIEFLETGEFEVYRKKDREELIAIKQGKWSFEDINLYVNNLMYDIDSAYKHSQLPPQPNYNTANELLMDVLAEYFRIGEL